MNDKKIGCVQHDCQECKARAAIAAAPQPQPVAWLVTGPSEKRSFDMQSFAESYCKGLNKGFGEDVYKISNLVVQSSEPHEKCNDERMCAACYSGQGKCKTQPVQQEPCPEFDGTGTVAGSQAHFPFPLCTSPQAQPQPVQEPVAWIERDMNCDDFDPDSVTCQKPDIAAEGWEWVPLYTTPQAQPLSDERLCEAMRKAADELLDHIYEFGTISEGVNPRLLAVGRSVEQAHSITKGTT